MNEQLRIAIFFQGYPEAEELPILTLEQFFEGNQDESSIGCNLLEHPGLSLFFKVLRDVRDKKNVQDVFVEIMEFYEEDEESWAFSERIYILSSASHDEVSEWLVDLEPTDVSEGYEYGEPKAAPLLKTGHKVYSVWWD